MHRAVYLFTSQLLLVLIVPAHERMARPSCNTSVALRASLSVCVQAMKQISAIAAFKKGYIMRRPHNS